MLKKRNNLTNIRRNSNKNKTKKNVEKIVNKKKSSNNVKNNVKNDVKKVVKKKSSNNVKKNVKRITKHKKRVKKKNSNKKTRKMVGGTRARAGTMRGMSGMSGMTSMAETMKHSVKRRTSQTHRDRQRLPILNPRQQETTDLPHYFSKPKFGEFLGVIIAPIVMALIYFFILTPISLIVRIAGKDLLKLKISNKKETYWIKRKKRLLVMKKQF